MRSVTFPDARSITASTAFGISSGFFFSAFALSTAERGGASGKITRFESGVNCGPPTGPAATTRSPAGSAAGGSADFPPLGMRRSDPLTTSRTTTAPSPSPGTRT